ncbi:permease prefix domain 1-containing protein [Demequina soli]|uniref:permease prefix domain 1-containing protein n=1 Tax=Demequina soli TaxID=1638987 RepID=UPI00078389F2|nr:permease prefix domain 1-containing protein [Demequina soli]
MNTDIHRLLDEAFEGVAMTPDARDLKEEIRANLMARAAELEASGVAPAAAARRAVEELGPVAELLGTPERPASAPEAAIAAHLHERHRVRPRPGFVVRTTLLAVLAAAAYVGVALEPLGVVQGGAAIVAGLGIVAALALGLVTADSLAQETTANHAMPVPRAVGYGLATFAVLAAGACGGAFAVATDAVVYAVAAGVLALAAIGLFAWLGATQTNRRKAWARDAASAHEPTRFDADPAAAARFGLYMAVLWTVGLVLAIVLAITLAWWWVLIILAACVAVMLLMLATMLFGGDAPHGRG